jgi:hypothetical protein
MATSTLIQYLAQNQTSGLGVSVPVGAGASNRSQEETFIAAGTIAKGDFVSLDSSKTGADKALFVVVVDTSGGAVALGVPTVGVALAAATAGQKVDVCVAGYCAQANVLSGTGANLALSLDTTTSGRAVAADAANVNICAVSLTAGSVSNTAEVMVLKRF